MADEFHAEPLLSVPHLDIGRYEAAGSLLRALTAPIRLAVIDLLADHPYCVHELVDAIGAPQPLVSQHCACCVEPGWSEPVGEAERSSTNSPMCTPPTSCGTPSPTRRRSEPR